MFDRSFNTGTSEFNVDSFDWIRDLDSTCKAPMQHWIRLLSVAGQIENDIARLDVLKDLGAISLMA
ncbi:hypothetical protein CX676_07630 [Paracoccus zhejiangensis]|uniref:Uncharacterized protein n=1 Tax=Paracoccus zhejiangensis TaxID=1077935 RepID=A0A2H5EXL5_9RHOB|nr:hypothetical protein CX676_07630 [Paracoccus zhejiangensis]